MRNKRWLTIVTALLVLVGTALTIRFALEKRSARQRQVQYRSTTRAYADAVLKQGASRADVEAYFNAHGTRFEQMCCVGVHRNAWADLVRIGQEKAPWYCSEHNIYVAFEFYAPERPNHQVPTLASTDKLVEVELYPRLEGCL